MKYGSIRGAYEIFIDLDHGEKEIDVLRAIIRASFETAPPVIGTQLKDSALSDEEINSFINLAAEASRQTIWMQEVSDRWCVTFLERVGKNHFRLGNAYQQYRGVPDPMFRRAQEILRQEKDQQSQEFYRRKFWAD